MFLKKQIHNNSYKQKECYQLLGNFEEFLKDRKQMESDCQRNKIGENNSPKYTVEKITVESNFTYKRSSESTNKRTLENNQRN